MLSDETSLRAFIEPYRIEDGRKFRLKDIDPDDKRVVEHKEHGKELLQEGVEMLADLQSKLYAQDRRSLLLVFQAMDAAGKDSTIKHVMSGINPQGCQVYSFKRPSQEELDHDYLWRTYRCLPERGRIGIFNRSYYEEVLVVRVHPELLAAQRLPENLIGHDLWEERFESINAMEQHLSRNGTVIRKFFLHVSKKEQKKRFLDRLNEPDKNWKFEPADVRERQFWDKYQDAYEDMIRHTATKHAPWFCVPADNKWFMRLVVAAAVIDALQSMQLKYPAIDEAKQAELERSRQMLESE